MSTTNDLERIESLETQVRELDAALKAARKIRLIFLAAVLAIMALIVFSFMGLYHKVRSEAFQTALAQEAQTRFEQNQNRYLKDVQSVIDKASPVITQAFFKQSKADMPKYTAALEQQREIFSKEIQDKLDAQLKKKYGELLRKYEDRLVQEFPELEDEAFRDKVIRSMDKALGKLASKYYTEALGTAIGGIYEDWDTFPAVDPPGKNDPELGDQLIGTLLELVSHRLSQ